MSLVRQTRCVYFGSLMKSSITANHSITIARLQGQFLPLKRADKRVAGSIEILMRRSGARTSQEMRRGRTRRVFRPHVATSATLVQAQTDRYSKFSPF